jgi:hypothetical protein
MLLKKLLFEFYKLWWFAMSVPLSLRTSYPVCWYINMLRWTPKVIQLLAEVDAKRRTTDVKLSSSQMLNCVNKSSRFKLVYADDVSCDGKVYPILTHGKRLLDTFKTVCYVPHLSLVAFFQCYKHTCNDCKKNGKVDAKKGTAQITVAQINYTTKPFVLIITVRPILR